MDIDLLRPGTAPLSSDTKLWFEFLLDEQLLKKHLQQPFPEPSATDLISKFLSVANNNNNVGLGAPPMPQVLGSELNNLSRRHMALKLAGLKVAAALKWNLDIFETKLAPLIQQQLLQDLVYMATDGAFSTPPQDIPVTLQDRPEVQFALTLYHRWILRFPVKAAIHAMFAKIPGSPIGNEYTRTNSDFDKMLTTNENSRLSSIKYLESVISFYDPPEYYKNKIIKIPAIDTFVHLSEDTNMAHKLDSTSAFIYHFELLMQIHFDMCHNYVFYKEYDKAKEHIISCSRNCTLLERETKKNGYGNCDKVPWGDLDYASISKEDVVGYIKALNLSVQRPLLQRWQESMSNKFKDMISVLQRDNFDREIPMVYRQMTEHETLVALSTGAEIYVRNKSKKLWWNQGRKVMRTDHETLSSSVTALNAVRYALDGGLPSTQFNFLNKFKSDGLRFFGTIIYALQPFLNTPDRLTETDWNNIRTFFLHLVVVVSSRNDFPIGKLIDTCLKEKFSKKDISEFRWQLIDKKHLQTIIDDQRNKNDDDIDIPQVLLTNDWDASDFKYDNDFDSNAPELEKRGLKRQRSTDKVDECFEKLRIDDLTAPLSPYWKPIGDLESLLNSLPSGVDKNYVKMCALAKARAEAGDTRVAFDLLQKFKGRVRDMSTDEPVWDRLRRSLDREMLVLKVDRMLTEWPHHGLDVALMVQDSKAVLASNSDDGEAPRSQVTLAAWLCLLNLGEWGTGTPAHSSCAGADLVAELCAACAELKGGGSKLPRTLWGNARMYNLLLGGIELVVEYTELWPDNISNGNSYNHKDVLTSLTELLENSLKLYPYKHTWLRLHADIALHAGHHSASLRRYLTSLSVSSEYFSSPAPGEGGVARRAASCCRALRAQGPNSLIFQTVNASDATDAYYGCLWDTTLLEVAVAYKGGRGAVAALRDLNDNNNDDIRRQAKAVRRGRLLRALTSQYVVVGDTEV